MSVSKAASVKSGDRRTSKQSEVGSDRATRQPSHEFIRKFGPLSVEVQQAFTAVLLLDSPEANIVLDSLNALQKFLKKCDENKEMYVEMGGLQPIQKMMYVSNNKIHRMAMKILAITSAVHKAKLFMRDMELAKDLLTLAETHQDDVIVEYATYSLSRLATLHTGRIQIMQRKCLPILAGLLSHSDPDIQRNSLEIIWQICGDPLQVGVLIGKSEYCEIILKLVDSEFPPIQILALLTLEKIASHPEGVLALESLEAFSVPAGKLSDDTVVDLHQYCLRVLFQGCRDRGTCKKFAYLAPTLTIIVEHTPDVMARIYALELMGRLCSIDAVAKNLAQCGIAQLIYQILKNSDLRLKEAAAFVIAQISRSVAASKKDFAKCIPTMLKLIENESTSERGLKCGLVAVSSIIEDTAHSVKEFTKASGFDTYKMFLGKHEKYSGDVVMSALCTIDTISDSPIHRPELIQAGFLPILLTLLQAQKDALIYTSVCNIICNILPDADTRDEFQKLKGPEILLNIITDREFQVVVAAIPIINAACADPVLGKDLLDMGLIQAMGNRSDQMINGPLRACFDRLISANPTLKYAIVGHISPLEKLENGFCDIGGLKRLDELKLPHDFKWEGKEPREKILLLNLGTGNLDGALLKNNPSLNDNKSDIKDIIDTVKSQKQSMESESALIETIAQAICDRFGGRLDKWRLTAKSEEVEIKCMQNKFKSVIVPVSSLSTGAFRTRALVFKAVCDAVGIPCSLETSDYKKTWNVVLLHPDENHPPMCACPEMNETEIGNGDFVYTDNLRKYVVDLVFHPGVLIPLGSFEAEAYITAY